jgi:hypothetical protein
MSTPSKNTFIHDGKARGSRKSKSDIDLKKVEALAKLNCPDEDFPQLLGISTRLYERRRNDPDFLGAIAKGQRAAQPAQAPRRGPGQPEKPINLAQLTLLCQMQCTDAEIAAFFKVSRKTIERRKQQPDFLEAMEQGKLQGLVSLRQAQFKAALAGNTAMMIWLGKQLLQQRDKPQEEESSAPTEIEYRWVAPEEEPKAPVAEPGGSLKGE